MANYNNGKYIKDAIESILNQTFSDWELIIVDDDSSDNSIEIISPFLNDKRIELVRHEKNTGCGAAKRSCAENARGEILGILDPDDSLVQNALEIMNKKFIENSDCGFIYSNFYICDENLRIKEISSWVGKINKGKTNLHEDKIAHFRMFKREDYLKTEGFDQNLKTAVDKDIIYKLEEVTKLKFIDLPLYFYRVNSDGISQGKNWKDAYTSHALVILSAYKRRVKNGFINLSKKEISVRLFRMLPNCIGLSRLRQTIKIFIEAVKIYPKNIIFFPFLIFGNRIINKAIKEISPYI